MNVLRKILGLDWRDKRIAELEANARVEKGCHEVLVKFCAGQSAKVKALTIPPLRTDETHTWTPHDSASWRAIMLSDLGKKFIGVTKQAHFRMCQAASANTVRPELDIHCARGFFECIKWAQLLTISPKTEGVSQSTTDGAQGEAQSTDQELADVLTRMSPK